METQSNCEKLNILATNLCFDSNVPGFAACIIHINSKSSAVTAVLHVLVCVRLQHLHSTQLLFSAKSSSILLSADLTLHMMLIIR